MAVFAPPPIRTAFSDKEGAPSYPWERWFQAVCNFLSAPQIRRFTPLTSSATGAADSITYDNNFIYVCVAQNTWKRTALSSF